MVEEIFLIDKKNKNIIKEKLANILYKENIQQSKIADLINISQPMVSLYLKSEKKVDDDIIEISQKIADKIIKGNKVTFQTCIIFSDKNLNGPFLIAGKNEILTDENSRLIENLKKAFYNIKEKDISGLVPKIKVNIAVSKQNPKDSDDVASFLDGLIISENKITGYNAIKFGKSKHLSSILIKHGKNLKINAVMNIAYNKKIGNSSLKLGYLTKDFNLKYQNNNYDILLHEGDFGIEPCAYILGKDAVDVSNKLLAIIGDISDER